MVTDNVTVKTEKNIMKTKAVANTRWKTNVQDKEEKETTNVNNTVMIVKMMAATSVKRIAEEKMMMVMRLGKIHTADNVMKEGSNLKVNVLMKPIDLKAISNGAPAISQAVTFVETKLSIDQMKRLVPLGSNTNKSVSGVLTKMLNPLWVNVMITLKMVLSNVTKMTTILLITA